MTTTEEDRIPEAGAVQADDDQPRFYLTVGAAMAEAQRVFDRLYSALGPAWRVTGELDAQRFDDTEVVVTADLARGEVRAIVRVWQGSERDVTLVLDQSQTEPLPVELDGGGDR